ncbi:MAG: hypothetical protein NW226_09025 [Microscillaceae bacterium]|nr:hypothetical protein [Microscillaceae bacterium]
MKQVFVWTFVCLLSLSMAKAQSDANKELEQAAADFQAEKYAEALPIFEKYREALEEALKDQPDNLKNCTPASYSPA